MERTVPNTRMLFRTLFFGAVFLGIFGLLPAGEARASFSDTITSAEIGQSFNVDWTLSAGAISSPNSGSQKLTSPLSATGTFTVVSFNANTLDLLGTIDNTTVLKSKLTQAYLMSVGISSNPAVTPSLITSGKVFTQVDSPGNFPGGFKSIDVCVFSANNCSGGRIKDGLAAGTSDSFLLALSGTFGSSPSITLSDFAVKFQTNEGSYEFGGAAGIADTPEPTSLLLFATALLLGLFGTIRGRLLPTMDKVRRI